MTQHSSVSVSGLHAFVLCSTIRSISAFISATALLSSNGFSLYHLSNFSCFFLSASHICW